MSSSNNSNNDGNKKKKIVCNPYAKKKKKTAPPVPSTFAYAPRRSSNTNNSNSNSNNNNNANHSGGSRNSYNNHNNSGGGGGGDTNSHGTENDTLFGTENMSFLAGSFSQAFNSIDETPNFRRASDSFQELKEKKSSSSKKKKKDNNKNSSTITATNSTTTAIGSSNSSNISSGNRDGASLSGPTKSINNTNYNRNNYNNNTNQKKEDDDVRLQHTMLQPHVLYVSPKQKGNSLLPLIRNVPIAYSAMIPDYIMGPTSCALFLSIKYHKLYPEYIYRRIAELGNNFLKSRIILVYVDVEDNTHALQQLNIIGVRQQYTVILCWSQIEAARYLETFKAKDGKTDISCITKKESTNIVDRVTDFLTSGHRGIGGVNKTDAATLWTSFGTIQAISGTSKDELALCPGMGPLKVRRLYDAFHKPFSKFQARERKQKRKLIEEEEEARAKTEQQEDDDENEEDGNDDNEKNSNNNNEDEKEGQEYEFE